MRQATGDKLASQTLEELRRLRKVIKAQEKTIAKYQDLFLTIDTLTARSVANFTTLMKAHKALIVERDTLQQMVGASMDKKLSEFNPAIETGNA